MELQNVNSKVFKESFNNLPALLPTNSLTFKDFVNKPPGESSLFSPVLNGKKSLFQKNFLNLYTPKRFHVIIPFKSSISGKYSHKWRNCQARFGEKIFMISKLKDRIRYLREEIFKVSQKKMAQLLDLPERTYQRMEQEERDIKSSIILKYVNLGVNPTWLLTGEGEMFLKKPDNLSEKELSLEEPLSPELKKALSNPTIKNIVLRLSDLLSELDEEDIREIAKRIEERALLKKLLKRVQKLEQLFSDD